ncbi:MAG: hypothetical protein IK079_03915 [Desulfovibrio sp.]|nr:hypothetical protein [Desulfovibrio sp.]
MQAPLYENPFRPGAGHHPPFLAGRDTEISDIGKLFEQNIVVKNVILTGLRGVGKTVLLDSLKPYAQKTGWLWTSSDMSEITSLTADNIVTRLLTDISIVTSSYVISEEIHRNLGFLGQNYVIKKTIDYDFLKMIFDTTPGLYTDKLKKVIEIVWIVIKSYGSGANKGIIFAYDEAQNLSDHAEQNQYPLSILLEVFQSLQKKGIPILLILSGLPTLFPKLVATRTYTERMFRIFTLGHLDRSACRDAILKPLEKDGCPILFTNEVVAAIIDITGGYPYFIQYICREVFDLWISQPKINNVPKIQLYDILCKLDTDFFEGRWLSATDRQRDLLTVIAELETCDDEFTVQEISAKSKEMLQKGFNPSHISQMLSSLSTAGLVYKNRKGKYSLAVPLMSQFIKRQKSST